MTYFFESLFPRLQFPPVNDFADTELEPYRPEPQPQPDPQPTAFKELKSPLDT